MGTCPAHCPFRNNGCYADGGPLLLHWRKVTEEERGVSWGEFLSKIGDLPDGQVWRHNQAGDLVSHCKHNCGEICQAHLVGLVNANRGKKGFTYTHYDVEGRTEAVKNNRKYVQWANEEGFTINLSANDPAHADKLAKLDIAPVTTHLLSDVSTATTKTPKGRKILVCPATRKDNVFCETCKVCTKYPRRTIIGFPAHGARKGRVDQWLQSTSD